ncbi:MAG: DUF1259 domain-containing protein [Fimbriimonadales bacterium]
MKILSRLALVAGAFVAMVSAYAQDVPKYYQAAATIIGKKGTLNADGSFRINIPRSDLSFTSELGMPIPVDMGLATYAAFSGTQNAALLVGDVAMLRHEIDGVVDALRSGGIEVVALHNHMTSESPRLFFMHFRGKGSVSTLARTFRKAIDACGKPAPKTAPSKSGKPEVDWAAIEKTLGVKRTIFDSGVVRFATPRKDLTVTVNGLPFLPGMGLGSWATFNRCECGMTMVMGDTCTTRSELQGVIDALRTAGISVTAIHNHIVGGSQELMFLHYEGEGVAAKLANGIRACWNALGKQPTSTPPATMRPKWFRNHS